MAESSGSRAHMRSASVRRFVGAMLPEAAAFFLHGMKRGLCIIG